YEEIELIKTLVCVPSIILRNFVYLHTLPLVLFLTWIGLPHGLYVLLTHMPHDSVTGLGMQHGNLLSTKGHKLNNYVFGLSNFCCAYFL
ncbi:hypothetical protein ACJX0J_020520, partial [Zea mays]